MKKTVLALAALTAGVSAQAQQAAETSSLAGTIDVTVTNEYLFRGAELSDLTLHPSVEFTYGDAYAGVWAAHEISDSGSGSSNNYKEYDFYAGYNIALNDAWKLDVGATQYVYPSNGSLGNDDTSFEAYVGVNGSIAGLSQSLYLYHNFDVDTYTAQYSTGYSLPIEAIKSSLDFTGTLGYALVDGTSDDIAGFSNDYFYYSIGASVPYQVSENAKLTVGVAYVGATEDDFSAPEVGGALVDNGKVIATVGLSVGF